MASEDHTKNWPELAMGLYDRLSGRGAEISYEFEDMSIKIPSGTGEGAEHAQWHLNGTVKVRTQDNATAPN